MIEMLDENTFVASSRGNKMILRRENSSAGAWSVTTDNASHRAWRGLGVSYFPSLKEVEQRYKTWRGVSLLVDTVNPHPAS